MHLSLPIKQAADATVAERGALYEGAVQVDERLGRVVGAIKVRRRDDGGVLL